MPDLSVIIPARNEEFLQATLDDINANMRGDTEIIAILDGYWPDPGIPDHPRITLIHHTEPVGQRAAVNEGARLSSAKYIMKADAHCAFDEGFDIKLMADCDPDWTVIPRMYNLHVFDWKCKKCGKTWYQGPKPERCDDCGLEDGISKAMIWRPRRKRRTDFAMFDSEMKFDYWKSYEKRPESQGDICDVMSSVGACFFMERERFWQLDGLDEQHGSWGQLGTEVACKAWLSGGRQVVNKKTWFAHMFRTKKDFSFPYQIKYSDQEAARAYSRKLWLGDKWENQVRPLSWLVEKFSPVPTWSTPGAAANASRPLVSVIIPARNEKYLQATIDNVIANMRTDFEIIVGLDDYDPDPALKDDVRVRIYRSKKRIGMRPMINILARKAKGRYLMRLDAHCMIAEGYDRDLLEIHAKGYTVLGVRYELDAKRWRRRERTNCDYRYLSYPAADPKGGLRGLPWKEMINARRGVDVDETMSISGSAWLMEKAQFDHWGGLDENHGTFGQEGAEIACKTWLSGGRLLVDKRTWYAHWNRGRSPYALSRKERDKSVAYSIDFWTNNRWPLQKYSFNWLIDKFQPPDWPPPNDDGLPAPRQGTILKGIRKLSVDKLWQHRLGICEPLKRYRLEIFFQAFDEYLGGRHDDNRPADTETQYFHYLVGHGSKSVRHGIGDDEKERILRKMRRGLGLYDDIEKNGLRAPLEFYQADNKLILFRGYRRLVILKRLGVKHVAARVHKTEQTAKTFAAPYRIAKNSINELGADQFAKYGGHATDKYYVHNYLEIYDRVLGHLRKSRIKLLEIGLLRGASLRLWHRAFPKAQIFGIDKNKTTWQQMTKDLDRVEVFVGMQEDVALLQRVARQGQFDIIIDDCGHQPASQLATFENLWGSLKPGGVYVIEDCYRSYKPDYAGPNAPQVLAAMVKEIYCGHGVAAVQFYYNLCIIEKGI